MLGKAGRAETSTDPGAVLDDGDGHRPEAGDGVAEGGYLVFFLGAAVGEGNFT